VPLLSNQQPDRIEAWVFRNSGWLAIAIIVAAFAGRFYYSAACYLHGDKAIHFNYSRPSSWRGAYEASRLLAHPPLFILLLHGIIFFGRSELILRMPSLFAGTAAIWLTFAWIRRSAGDIPGLAGLFFMAVSPAAISASTEVRQYGILLFFVCGSLYATERAFNERSMRWTILQGLFLLGALLTHYTEPVVLISLDFYVLLLFVTGGVPKRILLAIGASQLTLAAALAWLYFGHISRSWALTPASTSYLLSLQYASENRETLLGFLKRAVFGTFSYLLSRKLAWASMLVFLAGFAALLNGRTKARRLMALSIVSPFVAGLVAALCQVLPFAGSRHQAYLLPFVAMGLSAALTWIPRSLVVPSLTLGLFLAPLWLALTAPDNNPRLTPISDMTAAINYINRTIPRGETLFVDFATRQVLLYYLARDSNFDPVHPDPTEEARVAGYSLMPVWKFDPNNVLAQMDESGKVLRTPIGDPLWIVCAAFREPPLASRLPADGRDAKEFGSISVIETPHEMGRWQPASHILK
jgi:hypothetical protein